MGVNATRTGIYPIMMPMTFIVNGLTNHYQEINGRVK